MTNASGGQPSPVPTPKSERCPTCRGRKKIYEGLGKPRNGIARVNVRTCPRCRGTGTI